MDTLLGIVQEIESLTAAALFYPENADRLVGDMVVQVPLRDLRQWRIWLIQRADSASDALGEAG